MVATPALGAAVEYTFNITSGDITLDLIGIGSTSSGMSGTFVAVIDQSDGHIGDSDTIELLDATLANTGPLQISIGGLVTANVGAFSARITDFMQPAAAHIGAGGIGVIETDAFLEATVIVTGAAATTFSTGTSAGTLLPLAMTITTSVYESDTVTLGLVFTFTYEIVTDLGTGPITITLDLILDIAGTAHVTPDPALGGMTAFGLAGAGAWLRKRRS